MRLSMARSYGTFVAAVEGKRRLFVHMIVLVLGLSATTAALAEAAAPAKPVRMVVLGDSLSAGYGLPADAAFPARLEKSLKSNGIDADIGNAGVSGDTSSGGRDRLDWSVPEGTQAVILELGANDALRGTDPKVTRAALSDILTRLKARDDRGFIVRDACAAQLRQRLCDALRCHLSGACEIVRGAAVSVLPGGRGRRRAGSTRPTACIRPRRAST